MNRANRIILGLLALNLLLGGYGGFTAFRAHQLEKRLSHLEASCQELREKQLWLVHSIRHPDYGADTKVLVAPETVTVSGRDAQLKATMNQVNSVSQVVLNKGL